MERNEMNIRRGTAAFCAAVMLTCGLSGCGQDITDTELERLPDTAVTSDTSLADDAAVTKTEGIDIGGSDSLPAAEPAVTELSEDSSSAAEKKSSKKSKKSKKTDSSSEKENAVTDTDSSSAAEKKSGKSNTDDSSEGDESGKSEKSERSEKKPAENKSGDIILNYDDKLEAYSKVKLKDFIERTNAELIEPEALVDTKTLGEHEQTVKLKYDGQGYSATVRYTVEDTRAPIVLGTGENTYIDVGGVFDLEMKVSYADNFDRSPKLSYTGEVDTSAAGAYPITATVTDSSGNSYSWELTIYVGVEPPVTDTMTGDGMSFDEFRSAYAGDNRAFGIDVSQWQGTIDFNAVKEAGCEFVIMRIGWGDSDDYTLDNTYLANMENATAAGLPVGIYYYSEDNDPEDVRDHARWIAGILAGRKLDFPVVFDWEDFEHFQTYGMSIDDLNELFEVFADELSNYGYDAMLYSSKTFLENFWTNDYHRPVWLAHYVDQTDYAGEYQIWQRCYGSIAGIDGDADFNVLYK